MNVVNIDRQEVGIADICGVASKGEDNCFVVGCYVDAFGGDVVAVDGDVEVGGKFFGESVEVDVFWYKRSDIVERKGGDGRSGYCNRGRVERLCEGNVAQGKSGMGKNHHGLTDFYFFGSDFGRGRQRFYFYARFFLCAETLKFDYILVVAEPRQLDIGVYVGEFDVVRVELVRLRGGKDIERG